MADYMLIYKPQMDGYADESKVWMVSDPYLMGAFVQDITTLQHFCWAEIPVWFF